MSNDKKYTRLDLTQRIQIQSNLNEGASLSSIARLLGVSTSTVFREIKTHRTEDNHVTRFHSNSCVHRKDCKRRNLCPAMEKICRKKNRICSHCSLNNCNTSCPDYEKEVCHKPDRPPYVCNRCSELAHSKCSLTKYIYKASDANIAAADTRSSCRSGINITDEELKELNDLLTPRIQKGQSIHHIMVSEPGVFTISERQAYRLVNNGLIDAKPIDLPRAVRLKPRKKKATEKKVDRNCRKGRTYEDYLNYMTEHPDEPVLQGDTVEGKKGEKCILTLTWVQWSFQVGFLREHNNSASVTLIVNQLYESLGFELFHKVIPSVWLLDNGSEFSDPAEIEKYGIHVFYCDPSAPYQKGCCEVTHEYVRRILPKGTSFQDLDQDYIDFMYSHINSTCRKKLNDHSPFDSFSSVLGSGVLEKYFNITRIDPQSVHLKPSLKAIWDDQRKENN